MSRYRQIFVGIILLCLVSAYFVATRDMRRGLDLAGGMRIVYEARPPEDREVTPQMRRTISTILERRVNASGVVEPVVQPKPPNQFIVEIPDIDDKDEFAMRLARPSKLEFRYFQNVQSDRNPGAPYRMEMSTEREGQVSRQTYRFFDNEGNEVPHEQVIEESPIIVTGADLRDNARGDIEGMRSVVLIEFNEEGAEKFADFTRRHTDEHLAIIFNDEILSVPVVQEAIIGGRARITGNFNAREAQELANDLNAGALPVPLEIVQQNIVEASLGQQYVEQSLNAGLVGIILVALFMILYYLMPGVLATVALAMYALFTFAIFKTMGVTMTLPGLAGFILSVGMAVDANILIFERLKEELRAGKTLHNAIDSGFKRAWTAILDSNVCTLITCLILIALTTGPVVGFAKTLAIGVLVSMFTAITVTRTMLHLISNTGLAQNPRVYGLGKQWMNPTQGGGFDFIGRRPMWFGFSGVIIVVGLFFIFTGGIRPGIEFTGGTMIQANFPTRVSTTDIRSALNEYNPQVQLSPEPGTDSYTAFIRTRELTPTEMQSVRQAIPESFNGATVESTELVGASISREITEKAIAAVIIACLAICIYLSVRFSQGGFIEGLKFGVCALLALMHDVLVVLGASAIFGRAFGWEIGGAYVTAMLTMIGYSVHDTIVVFDRVRENMKLRLKGETFEQLVNRSILQSFARSINTSLTVCIVLGTLLIFGGSVIRHFNAVLLVGIVIGTYSSIFTASPLLVMWNNAARKQKGRLSPAEMKPIVTAPSSADKRLVGEDSSVDEESEEGLPAETGKPRPKSPGTKRRKRRF